MTKWLFLVIAVIVGWVACWGQTVEEARELHLRGYALLDSGDYVQGREVTCQAMEMRRQLLGEVSEDYITSLNNYALSFAMEEDFNKAAELQERVMSLCDKLPEPHPNLGLYSTNLGRYRFMTDDIAGAAQAWERAMPLVEKYGKVYEYILGNLGLVYDQLGDKANLERILALQKDFNEHELAKPCDDPQCQLERAQYYASTGNNAEARQQYMKLMSMPMDDEMTVKAYDAYSKFLMNVKDYEGAAEYARAGAAAQRRIESRSEGYAQLMFRSAIYSFLGSKYQQAVDSYQMVIDLYSHQDSPAARKNIANCLKGMGNAYSGLHDYGKAKVCFQQVVDYYQENDPDNNEYPKVILNLAKAEKYNKEYDASITHHEQAIKLMEERGMNNELTDAYTSMQLCYAYAGRPMPEVDYSAADATRNAKLNGIINEQLSDLEITRKYLGSLYYARSLAEIAGCYAMLGQQDQAVDYFKRHMSAVRDAIRDEFRLQDEAQRMATWQDEASAIQQLLELMVSLPIGQESLMDELAGVVYDAELLSKGILLNSSIEFEKVLARKDNKKLKAAYEQSKANADQIATLRLNAANDEDLELILMLTQQNQTLLQQLYRDCAEVADFTDYISYDWHNVQSALGKDDVAIEFAAVKSSVFDQDNFMVALVLTRDMLHPIALPVCSLAQAKALEDNDVFFESSNNLVWGALSQYLVGKRRIFFSADGCFNHTGIEYLPYNGKPLSEQFEVYRLSSTKELCYRHAASDIKHVMLMGYIDYNTVDGSNNKLESDLLEAVRGKHGLPNLPKTRQEISDIETILSQSKRFKKVEAVIRSQASRSAFERLNDSHVGVIHIATHGVYIEQKNASDSQSMFNCLLALAGANMTDDAFVSAADIARMNLRECDLAVLSACETGLGKLGGDGVFGLQRGFKNAGVHTLLMSLKKVTDESTAMLMTNFYKYWIGGSTKREALVNAQRELRTKGYIEPKYWATFILLDAMN